MMKETTRRKKAIKVVLPEALLEQMDRLIKEDRFTSRAEIIKIWCETSYYA